MNNVSFRLIKKRIVKSSPVYKETKKVPEKVPDKVNNIDNCTKYNANETRLFRISKFATYSTININCIKGKHLTFHANKNEVYFCDKPNKFQLWIIENDLYDNSIYYIRCANRRTNHTHYLGCPNANNNVFLYTSKNRFTKWSIQHTQDDMYHIQYIGEKFDACAINMVVARYNEDVEWTLAYNDIVTLYNKGLVMDIKLDRVIQVENIGREGHTYLYHMSNKYNTLTEKTIFLQGDPFIHNDTILFGVDNYDQMLDVQPMGLIYLKDIQIPPDNIAERNKIVTDYGLEYLVVHVNANHDYCEQYYFHDEGVKKIISAYNNKFPGCPSLVEHFLNRSYFKMTKPIDQIRYTWCGLFALSKDSILNYDISTYKNLMNELTSYNKQGGENGYILERLWLYIFEPITVDGR
jgi:hypothetical protein